MSRNTFYLLLSDNKNFVSLLWGLEKQKMFLGVKQQSLKSSFWGPGIVWDNRK